MCLQHSLGPHIHARILTAGLASRHGHARAGHPGSLYSIISSWSRLASLGLASCSIVTGISGGAMLASTACYEAQSRYAAGSEAKIVLTCTNVGPGNN